MNKKDELHIINDIQVYFGFLTERSFVIEHFEELPMGDWEVTLIRDDLNIIIYSDRGEVDILFSIRNSNEEYRVGLRGMIFYLTNGKKFIDGSKGIFTPNRKKQFEYWSRILRDYFDQIIPYFGPDYEKYKTEIKATQQKLLDIYLDKYFPPHKNGNL